MPEAGHEEIARPFGLLITSVINAGVMIVAAGGAAHTLADFREIFTGFGADVPPATMFLVKNAWIWWLLAIISISLAAWVARRPRVTPRELRSMKIAVRVSSVCLGFVILFAIIALYGPIFRLGAEV
jgi:FtsH-binding integral membrane protein